MDRLSATLIAEQALVDIAAALGATLDGTSEVRITNLCTLEPGEEGGLSFLAQGSYAKHLCECKATAVIVNQRQERPEGFEGTLLRVNNPYEAWSKALDLFGQHVCWGSAAIDPTATIHPSVQLAPGVTIGAGVEIGAGTVLHPGVTIYPHSIIGENCILHAGVVIGADGFGFAPPSKAQDGLQKIKHIGHVILGNHVEIGANSCVDRAVVGATIIGLGTKLDNLCQIGHNVQIGMHCVLAGQVGIAGSASVGNGVQIGGQVGIAGHIHIGDGVRIGAQSGVHKNIEAGKTIMGSPAVEASVFRRKFAASNMKPRS
ncbi:MAG TPA: UDP-3-O-(3-hydroxymyristoyl)glucosamine N-acyltransferase [Cryomorphaceae bacterium]|nr:UDP-3-O-(3-hydroxymyristoyl)glucosamine N-acyltransferase [Cryomorphaceae bacterium]